MTVTEGYAMTEEEQAAHVASTEAAMRANGIPTEDVLTEDYFAFDVEHKVVLPDGVQYVLHKELNEGARKKYLNAQNRDATIQRVTGDMKVRMSPGDERHSLLSSAITGWHLLRGPNREPVPFDKRNLAEFLEKAPPRIVDLIEKDVRKSNPWLLAETSVEDIDKEIENLMEMREARRLEDEGKSGSSSK
jgi:hypothetical protein